MNECVKKDLWAQALGKSLGLSTQQLKKGSINPLLAPSTVGMMDFNLRLHRE